MQVFDSYTGEEYIADYVSKIPDIQRGRSAFWKREHYLAAAQQYWVSPYTDPSLPATPDSPATPNPIPDSHLRDLRPSGYILRRKDSPSDLFPVFPSQEMAIRAMDWCVRNDASVRIVLHWINQGNKVPYLCLMQDVIQAATGDSNA